MGSGKSEGIVCETREMEFPCWVVFRALVHDGCNPSRSFGNLSMRKQTDFTEETKSEQLDERGGKLVAHPFLPLSCVCGHLQHRMMLKFMGFPLCVRPFLFDGKVSWN